MLASQNPSSRRKQPHELEDSRRRAKAAFSTVEFLQAFGLPIDITEQDREQARNIFLAAPNAPLNPTTPGAAVILEALLTKYDYEIINSTNKMRNYVLFQLFDVAESAKSDREKLKAIELLGKVAEIGLFTQKIEISVEQKSTSDLEDDLRKLLRGYNMEALEGELVKVQDQTSLEAEMRGEITDEELLGESEWP